MSVNTDLRQQEIIREFSEIAEWEDRYRQLIQLGRSLPPYPEEHRTEDFKVKGCQAQVWLHPALTPEGRVCFDADSDAALVRGLVALVLRVYSDATPREVIDAEPTFVREIGLADHLSPTRANGLAAMIRQIKLYGVAYQSMLDAKRKV